MHGASSTNQGRETDEVTDELRRLLDAVASKAEDYLRDSGSPREQEDGSTSVGSGRCADSCGWCPVCAVVAILRGERTEATTRLAEQATGVVRLLREMLSQHETGDSPDTDTESSGTGDAVPGDPGAGRPRSEASGSAGKVQRIDVRRVSGRVARPASADHADSERSEAGTATAGGTAC